MRFVSREFRSLLIILLLLPFVLSYQACGSGFGARLLTAEQVFNSGSNKGTLSVALLDNIGMRDLAVPAGEALASTQSYQVMVESLPTRTPIGESVWSLSTQPENVCALDSSAGIENMRMLQCTSSAKITLRVEYQYSDGISQSEFAEINKEIVLVGQLAAVGETLYKQNCAACHGETVPSLLKGTTAEKLGDTIMSVPSMTAFAKLSPTSLRSISSYLSSSLPAPTPAVTPTPAPGGTPAPTATPKSTPTPAASATPTSTPTPVPTPVVMLNGGTLYAAKCQGCHGTLDKSNRIGTSVSALTAAIKNIPIMGSLANLSQAEIEAIVGVLAVTEASAPVSPGYSILNSRFELFLSENPADTPNTTIRNAYTNGIMKNSEFTGGICQPNQDPVGCKTTAARLTMGLGAAVNPNLSSMRRGYITKTCEEILSLDIAVTNILAKRNLTVASDFSTANISTVFQIFAPGRTPPAGVISSLTSLGTAGKSLSGQSREGWRFVLNTICTSTVADLL